MPAREPCPACGGSGQVSYFKGVSRFLLSCEECPECAGLGFRLDPVPPAEAGEKPGNRPAKSRPKKKTKEKQS
jgi:ssDNA-binding Zn-finger/Zn-ribbon topoisomerase 1